MLAFVLRPYRGAPPGERGRRECAGAAPRIRNSCYRRFRNSFLMSCLLLFFFAFYTLSDVVVRAEIATDHLIEVGGGGLVFGSGRDEFSGRREPFLRGDLVVKRTIVAARRMTGCLRQN